MKSGWRRSKDLSERFWQRVNRNNSEVCWAWTGSYNSKGYGQLEVEGIKEMAHRISYELSVGPIPEAMSIHHRCNNPSCVNPNHLEPMAIEDNILLGNGEPAQNARKTHCHRGHELVEPNLIPNKLGLRHCRACRRDEMKRLEALIDRYREALEDIFNNTCLDYKNSKGCACCDEVVDKARQALKEDDE